MASVFEGICRICESQENLTEIFAKNNPNVIEKLELVANISVQPDDKLPKFICSNCLLNLEVSYDFKLLCEATDSKLRKFLLSESCEGSFVEVGEKGGQTTKSCTVLLEIGRRDSENGEGIIEEVDVIEEIEKPELDDSFNDEAGVKEHKHQCETCSKGFRSYTEFNKHKRTHGRHRFQCRICEKWYQTKYKLKTHLATHTTGTFKCPKCQKSYINNGNLLRHIRTFHDKKHSHFCEICGRGFSQKSILDQHMLVHTDELEHECDVCGKKFKTNQRLAAHKMTHMPPDERPKTKKYPRFVQNKNIVCSYCGKISKCKFSHECHLRVHTGEKPFECNVCHRKFTFQHVLKIHSRMHSGAKPYKCDICGTNFRQYGHLRFHKLVHTGEKPNQCLVCGKSFALKSNLVVHLRMHTGETPYQCEKCPKKFCDSNGLKRHRRTHLKDRENDIPIDEFTQEYHEKFEVEEGNK